MPSGAAYSMISPAPAALFDRSPLSTDRLDVRACEDADVTALQQIVAHRAVYESFYLQGMPIDAARRIREPWGRQVAPDGITTKNVLAAIP